MLTLPGWRFPFQPWSPPRVPRHTLTVTELAAAIGVWAVAAALLCERSVMDQKAKRSLYDRVNAPPAGSNFFLAGLILVILVTATMLALSE